MRSQKNRTKKMGGTRRGKPARRRPAIRSIDEIERHLREDTVVRIEPFLAGTAYPCKKKAGMEYWVVSTNVSRTGGRVLQKWNDLILERKCAFMGWSSRPDKDTRLKLGQRFADAIALRRGVEEGDLILLAYRKDGEWHLVACGIVNSEARRSKFTEDERGDLHLEAGYRGTERELNPFVDLQRAPKRTVSMEGTTPDRRRVIWALVKLKPDSNHADRELCRRLMGILQAKPVERDLQAFRRSDRKP